MLSRTVCLLSVGVLLSVICISVTSTNKEELLDGLENEMIHDEIEARDLELDDEEDDTVTLETIRALLNQYELEGDNEDVDDVLEDSLVKKSWPAGIRNSRRFAVPIRSRVRVRLPFRYGFRRRMSWRF